MVQYQTAYSPIINAIQNTADYKEDIMKTLYKKFLSLKTINDKIIMSLKNNINKKEKNNMNRTMNRRKIKIFFKYLICSHILFVYLNDIYSC